MSRSRVSTKGSASVRSGHKTWSQSLCGKIFRITIETGSQVVRRSDLLSGYLPEMIDETGSVGKTPEQTVSREIQNLRDTGIIAMDPKNKGTYKVIKNLADIDRTKKNASKGEVLMEGILNKFNISYVSQFVDQRIKNIRPLPFDFLAKISGKSVLIEFDGEDHYQIVRRSRDEAKNTANFERRKRLDRIKTDGARDHGYELVRIQRRDVLRGSRICADMLESRLMREIEQFED